MFDEELSSVETGEVSNNNKVENNNYLFYFVEIGLKIFENCDKL
jgi:hypothetical protein